MLSPFWMPMIVPLKTGLVAPYIREASWAYTVSAAAVTLSVP